MCSPLRASLALALCLAAAPLAAAEPQRLIGPGDLVPGFGRIGGWGFTAHGLDDAGRVLLVRDGDARTALWAGDDGLATVLPPDVPFPVLLEEHIDLHPNGAFAFVGLAAGERAIFAVEAGQLRRVAGIGDHDPAGATLCGISNPHINAAGAVAFQAAIASPGQPCEPIDEEDTSWSPLNSAMYIAAGGLQRLAKVGTILALTEDGRVVLDSGELVDADGSHAILPPDVRGPSGQPIAIKGLHAANRRGVLVFWGMEAGKSGLYRGDASGVTRLFASGDPAPWGVPYQGGDAYQPYLGGDAQSLNAVAVNDAGDVLIVSSMQAVVLFPPDGDARAIHGYALGGGWLNDRGQVALVNMVSAAGTLEVVRWQGDAATRLAGSGDLLPDGSYLLSGGLTGRCIGPDGSVAVVADAAPGAQGLLCGDANGFRASVRVGDGTPVGRRFFRFDACAIPRPGEIVFLAERLLPPEPGSPYTNRGSLYTNYETEAALYRVDANGVQRLIGPGDVTDDGAPVAAVQKLNAYSLPPMVTNERSDVLAQVILGDRRQGEAALVVRESGGGLRRLAVSLGSRGSGWGGTGFPPGYPLDHEYLAGLRDTPRPAQGAALSLIGSSRPPRAAMPQQTPGNGTYSIADAHLLDDGSAIMLALQGESRWRASVVLSADSAGVAPLFSITDPAFAAFDVDGFDALFEAGGWIVLQTSGRRTSDVFGWRRGEAQPTHLFGRRDIYPDGSQNSFSVRGITADGRVYIDHYRNNHANYGYWQAGVLHDVGEFALNLNWLTDVGADGTLLLQDGSSSVLALGGGLGGTSCPAPPTIVLPTLTVTATPTITPTPTATRTATATRSASPTRSATPTATVARCGDGAAVCLRVGEAHAAPGGTAEIRVRLAAPGVEVVGTQNDLRLPAGLTVSSCAVNPDIAKADSAFNIDGERVRALVLALDNVAPIADGADLYTCTLAIDATVAPGQYPIGCARPGAAAADGAAIAAGCADGALSVSTSEATVTGTATPTESAAPTASPSATAATGANAANGGATGAGSCNVAPTPHADAIWLLPIAALLAWRRRARSGR